MCGGRTLVELTKQDCEEIGQALGMAIDRIRRYETYPTPGFKQQRIATLEALLFKVATMKQERE